MRVNVLFLFLKLCVITCVFFSPLPVQSHTAILYFKRLDNLSQEKLCILLSLINHNTQTIKKEGEEKNHFCTCFYLIPFKCFGALLGWFVVCEFVLLYYTFIGLAPMVTVNLNTYLYYTSIYCVCTVVMLCSVMQRLGTQDKCLYRTIKYILSHFIRLLRVMVIFSLSQPSWAQQICEDIRLVISCCVLICQELPDQRGHHTWCQRHVLP